MGTNYYTTYIDNEKQEAEELHIGKSSGGWCFSLHAVPELNLMSWDSWKEFLTDRRIYDEYGEDITLEEFTKRVCERSWLHADRWKLRDKYYSSWEDYFEKNGAQIGPNNLLRHKIDRYCIAHGKETWDLILGDFR